MAPPQTQAGSGCSLRSAPNVARGPFSWQTAPLPRLSRPSPRHAPAVNNAGTNTQGPTLGYSQDDYRRIMGTNQEASYALCQAFHPLLAAGAKADANTAASSGGGGSGRRRGGGSSIVFISSVAGGPLAGRSGSLYAMSKAALNQLAKSLACEWAKDGIRVNSVAPWVTLTEMGKQVHSVVLGCRPEAACVRSGCTKLSGRGLHI